VVELIVLVSLWVIFLGLLFYAHTNMLRLLFLSVLGVLLFIPSFFFSVLAWVVKDGIAPDEGYSEGWQAWYLFFQEIWPFLILVTVFVVAGYFANQSAHKRIEANRESPGSLLEL
jgi:hypothetical protein